MFWKNKEEHLSSGVGGGSGYFGKEPEEVSCSVCKHRILKSDSTVSTYTLGEVSLRVDLDRSNKKNMKDFRSLLEQALEDLKK